MSDTRNNDKVDAAAADLTAKENHVKALPKALTQSVQSSATGDHSATGFTSSEDENDEEAFADGSERSHQTTMSSLQGNLMRAQKSRNPMKIYEVLEILGEGSMGRVSRVRKRQEAVGGSARPSFVRKHKGCCFQLLAHVQRWFPSPQPALVDQEDNDVLLSASMATQAHSNTTTAAAASCASESTATTSTTTNGKVRGRRNRRKDYKKARSSLVSFASDNDGGEDGTKKKQVTYALKSIHLNRCSTTVFVQELKNEVAILKGLDHPHIVRAIETYDYRHRLYIVLELCSGGDLYTREPYTEPVAKSIVSALLSAVSYLHHRGIVHRDLKFENIMFVNKESHDIKLIDFGLSQKFAHQNEHLHDQVGTVYTMAPELLQGDYTSQADVWSCGVITFMVLSSSMPFYGKTRVSVIKKILQGRYAFLSRRWKHISQPAKELVRACLTMDANQRPTASDAQNFAWLQGGDTGVASCSNGTPLISNNDSSVRSNESTTSPTRAASSADPAMTELDQMDQIQTSILAFSRYSQLKKLALLIVAYQSTTEEIGFLKTMFEKFDLQHDGEITAQEFQRVLSAHYNYTQAEMQTMFEGIDVDGTGAVHYSEFLAATLEARPDPLDGTCLAEAFDRLDSDDSGYITVKNLRDFLGPDVPEKYLHAVIDQADLEGDHCISYQEFMQLWSSDDDEARSQFRLSVSSRHLASAPSFVSSFSDGDDITSSIDEKKEAFPTTALGEDSGGSDQPGAGKEKKKHPSDPPSPQKKEALESRACFKTRKALSVRAAWI